MKRAQEVLGYVWLTILAVALLLPAFFDREERLRSRDPGSSFQIRPLDP